MIKHLGLALSFYSFISCMEPVAKPAPVSIAKNWLGTYSNLIRDIYFPHLPAAQTPDGLQLCAAYVAQMLPHPMPNQMRFAIASTYLRERYEGCDLPRIICPLRAYVAQVIGHAITFRDKKLGPHEFGNELSRAVTLANAHSNANASTRDVWDHTIGPALKAYHLAKNSVESKKGLR